MSKSNIRSMRFTDDTLDLINGMAGETFTKKFELLIFKAFLELPLKEREIKRLDSEIEAKLEYLGELDREVSRVKGLVDQFSWITARLEQYCRDRAPEFVTQTPAAAPGDPQPDCITE